MLALLLEAAFRSFLVGIAVWLGINVLRARGTQVEALAWSGVLTASLLMPLLMGMTAITIVVPTPLSPIWTIVHMSPLTGLIAVWLGINVLRARNHGEALAWTALLAACFSMQVIMAITPVVFASPLNAIQPTASLEFLARGADLPQLLTALYVSVALAMLLRLSIGLFLTLQLYRRAKPVRAAWTRGRAVRVSAAIAMPGTFGSTILLPKQYVHWPLTKRNAVIAHESSHVRRGDFWVLLLAAIHRCVFWFSPLAWFLEARLALLAEMASDDAAVEVLCDRSKYAGFLFEFATKKLPATAIAMARPENIVERIDRILAQAASPPALTRRKRFLFKASLAVLVTVAAGLSPAAQTQVPHKLQAKPVLLPGTERSTNGSERQTGAQFDTIPHGTTS